MNKSLITNIVSAGLVAAGLLIDEPLKTPILSVGMFALAGGLTNWVAIHMLFEKVPGLYGSGVITAQFEQFKQGIHDLVMEQFFSRDNIDRFVSDMVPSDDEHHFDFSPVIERTDLSPAYDSLVTTIMESSFGSMLGMFGGVKALEPLKDPFIEKMKLSLNDMASSDAFQENVKANIATMSSNNDLSDQIELVVNARLDELTPNMVKDIIQSMIKEHLGWLVVWGGVFGGVIGLLASQLPV
jgi:uncharacterized membrane protein YheB (UPF0754 family)